MNHYQGSNSLIRRLEMYAMINSIENDFISNFEEKLSLNDIPDALIDRSQNVNDKDDMNQVLRGLDLQAYIEICNANIIKLGISIQEKNFINNNLSKIISIRNKVMHPRLFEFYDYPMLRECFNNISNQLHCMKWDNVYEANRIINEEPSLLLRYEKYLKKCNNVIENIPTTVDFDDTSFIGRKKEIGEIKEKLFKKNVHILSILGDGGIGKTAITIKLLYDLLDDEKNPFEVILWVSLKTKELNNYEFSEIANAIDNIGAMYEKLNDFIGGQKNDVKQNLVELAKQFNTLLVLDNLETINTEDVRDFLDEFTEYGKVIITSRIGLGEMEHRYFLQGLSDSDLLQYVNTLLDLYNKTNYLSQEEKVTYTKEELHSNPLAIKWFIRGLADGQTPQSLLGHKDNLINFCMSNVYDKLSIQAKEILNVIKSVKVDLTYAELAYLIGEEHYKEVEVRGAINELCKCNFLNPEKFQFEEILTITDFANEYIKQIIVENTEKRGELNQKLKNLNAFDQSMVERRYIEPYSLRTFYYDLTERKKSVASYYLSEALTAYFKKDNELSIYYINLAKSLCPKFFECNKIYAYILRNSDPQKAIEEYEIAKKNARTNKEIRLVLINYKEFCLSNNDYEGALDAIEQAIAIEDEILLQFEKEKILASMGRYEEAEQILLNIQPDCIGKKKIYNIFLTRKADLLKRKAESSRDREQRIELLKQACKTIKESQELDSVALNYLAQILNQLMHYYYIAEIVEYIYKTIKSVDGSILKTKAFKDLRKRFSNISDKIPYFENREEFLNMLIDYSEICSSLNSNEGIVYQLKDKFGFVRTQQFYQGIFFSLSDIDFEIRLGDIVRLGYVYSTPRGFVVKELKFIRHSY